MELTDFLHAGTNSHKLKGDWNLLGWNIVKNGCGQSSDGTLKLSVSEEWTDGINWFFACWYKFRKAKSYFNDSGVGMVKNCYGLLVHETLKSAVSEEWMYELSWFFE